MLQGCQIQAAAQFGYTEHAKTREQVSVRYKGLRYSSRAAQQGCGDSEKGISSGETNVLTVIQHKRGGRTWFNRITTFKREQKKGHSLDNLKVFSIFYSAFQEFPSGKEKHDTFYCRSLVKQVSKEKAKIKVCPARLC